MALPVACILSRLGQRHPQLVAHIRSVLAVNNLVFPKLRLVFFASLLQIKSVPLHFGDILDFLLSHLLQIATGTLSLMALVEARNCVVVTGRIAGLHVHQGSLTID